ncbi:outer membrane beta-barrel protein [Solimonas soli]|uniref:outer membrane beta-barrel protein n=1 Tax=Solimonas soli TaxID=413479 RepID=UPI0004839759|nr:outer membrane beta-barrel protein [Solimonas soli]
MPIESWRRAGRAGLLLCAATLPQAARAGFDFTPYVAASGYYDSNVFCVSGPAQALARGGDDRLSDRVLRAVLGSGLDYRYGRQELKATLEGRALRYDHFGELDHQEHRAALDYRLPFGDVVELHATAADERRQASLADRQANLLAIEHERSGDVSLQLAPGDDWRFDADAHARRLQSPLAEAPDFALTEQGLRATLRRVGEGPLSLGLGSELLQGRFSGIGDAQRFTQYGGGVDLRYEISGLTRLQATLGASRRNEKSAARDDVSALTGSLGVEHALSGVTSVRLDAFRSIDSDAGVGRSRIANGAGAALIWRHAIVGAELSAQWTRSDFADEPRRRDDSFEASLRVPYQMRRWLAVTPFARRFVRDSSDAEARYHVTTAGLELRAQFGGEASR